MSSGQPQRIGDVLSQLMRAAAMRECVRATCSQAWSKVAGEALAACTRATQVRRGVLEVLVSNSMMVQEIGFQKPALLERLAELLPDENIRDLKLRVGPIT